MSSNPKGQTVACGSNSESVVCWNRHEFLLRSGRRGGRLLATPRNPVMSFFGQLANFFTRGGRDENRLQQGMAHAHSDRPEKAIEIYDALLNSKSTGSMVRAKTLFNRALAHSSRKNDAKALADLKEVIGMPAAPENVLTAARTQLIRV